MLKGIQEILRNGQARLELAPWFVISGSGVQELKQSKWHDET
jgi:hypothetical protein